jgi:hypothetical protein
LVQEAAEEAVELPPPGLDPPVNPAHAQLGSEGLARLRARYADVMAGISRRVTVPERLEELRGAAERLNPDSWVTDEEVRRGLEEYETVFESIRGVIGRRRRRRRTRSGQANRDGAPENSSESGGETAEPDAVDEAPDGPEDEGNPG